MVTDISHPAVIDQPMVLLPVREYRVLLEEAGYTSTPELDKEIEEARTRFRQGKTISWESLKNELQD